MTKDELIRNIRGYVPFNEQEEADQKEILRRLESGEDLITRENRSAHLTASAWVTAPGRDRVLMVYHNLYHSWSWLGGHADGDYDLPGVAVKEVREESGIRNVRLVTGDIYSMEILTVDGHEKHGVYVPSHLHLNVTYLLEADPQEAVRIKPDENSGVAWFDPEEAVRKSTEPWFRERIYRKLNQKLYRIGSEQGSV